MDVKGAYPNGKLKEEIFMMQPKGYSNGTSQLCWLIKTLYGLKQSGCEWNEELDTKLKGINFEQLLSDACVYIQKTKSGVEIITVWMDNLLVFTNSKELMHDLKAELKGLFDITDLGEPSKLIRIEITQDRANKSITIKQERYIKSILEKEGLDKANPVSTPLDPNVKLEPQDQGDDQEIPKQYGNYASLMGSIMYVACSTRPNIAYTTNTLCGFTANPSMAHWSATKRLLRYLKGTKDVSITYEASEKDKNKLYVYSDANFANKANSISVTGYATILNGAAIMWCSQRQKVVALLTTEAEYMAMASASREIMWLRNLLKELGYTQREATTLYSDNQSAIAIAYNPQYHKRSKHFRMKDNHIREKVWRKKIKIEYCQMTNMVTDALTKALPQPKHTQHMDSLGLTTA